MTAATTIVAGIEVPSVSPVLLTVVAIHVLFGIACVVTGVIAMLSEKRRGRHPIFGTIYYWCLSAVFATATVLAAPTRLDISETVRWLGYKPSYSLANLLSELAAYGDRGPPLLTQA